MLLCESISPWITPIVGGAFLLSGVWLGSYLNQRNTFVLSQRQKRNELRIRSYAKLMGLKLPLVQSIHTNCEAKILCEYYETRSGITNSSSDLDEAKRQNERGLGLIPRIADFRREVSETLGDIQVAFNTTPEMDSAIEKLFRASSIEVPETVTTMKTISDIEKWKETNIKQVPSLLKSEYSDNFDSLLGSLLNAVRLSSFAPSLSKGERASTSSGRTANRTVLGLSLVQLHSEDKRRVRCWYPRWRDC